MRERKIKGGPNSP